MKVLDDDGMELLKELQEKRGGKIGWRVFATWYADTDAVFRDRGVFLYKVDDTYWFEDFEPHPQFLGLEIKPKAGAPKYVKFEGSFKADDVKDVFLVSKKTASDYANGFSNKLTRANAFTKLFTTIVTAVVFKDSSVKFFEVFGKDLINQIESNK